MSKSHLSVVEDLNPNDAGKTISETSTLTNHDIIEIKKVIYDTINTLDISQSLEGGNSMSNYITKDTFEQFEKRIDDKLDTLPERMADKMDAKINGLEARQTKWFVGILASVMIGLLGIIINFFV